MSTLKTNAITSRSGSDLSLSGDSGNVVDIEANFKIGGVSGVPGASIRADAIDGSKIADDSINSEHYVAASIDNEHLADDAVGIAELSATGTASASNFLRGDNSWAAAGGGKVQQVVTAYSTSVTTLNNASMTDVPGISINITPTSSSNKIILMGQFHFRSSDQYCYGQIVRRVGGSDALPAGWLGDTDGSRVRSTFGNNYQHTGDGNNVTSGNIPFVLVDTNHSTTSQITYQLQYRLREGSYVMYFGRSASDPNDNTTGRAPRFFFTAMEVE